MSVEHKISRPQHDASAQLSLKNALDQQLDQLIKDVLPSSPYLLRMPYQEDNPRLKPPSQRYWSHGTPFAPEEEAVQYTTFHQSPGGCLRSVGQWDDGKGGIAPPEPLPSNSSSGRTPLQNQGGTKKKMTIAEWKNRDKSVPSSKDSVPADKKEIANGGSGDQSGQESPSMHGSRDQNVDIVKNTTDTARSNDLQHTAQDSVGTKR